MIEAPYSHSAKTVLEKLDSTAELGLTAREAKRRLAQYGENTIAGKGPKKGWEILIDQIRDPIIFILAAAAVLTFLFNNDWPETVAILVVIAITVTIGFFMELQGVRSLEALRKMGTSKCSVLREGKIFAAMATNLVPGDIILIEAGDVVPADARLLSVENLSVKEASLTGESNAIPKATDPLPDATILSERTNMVFKGTSVVQGSATAVVAYTGRDTELGKIQKMGSEVEAHQTPLERKLNELSKWLIWLTLVFAVLIVFTGYLRGLDIILIIETAIALAVAAIPEGLPVVATIGLARGMLKLSKRQIIIKKMEAVETLGATNIICTDKTGTLTEDHMQVHTLAFADATFHSVQNKAPAHFDPFAQSEAFNVMVMTGILCNNVVLNTEEMRGDGVELALIQFAEKLQFDPKKIREDHPEKMEIPFDTTHKLMATLNEKGASGFTAYVKGAFETVVNHCHTVLSNNGPQPFTNKKEWFDRVDEMASQGLRVLAFAYKNHEVRPEKADLLSQLTFIGLIGFLDPAREDVKSTIEVYKEAGIKVVMMTGDHPGTARKIAEEIGLISETAPSNSVVHGSELQFEKTTDHPGFPKILDAAVFARVTPEQKLNLVSLYQDNDNTVAMFGDGINDIPALRKADIGIAMGVRGTEAAREAADIILKNDRFTAMELAISQGRAIFDHIRQFVVYLLSCNLAEVLTVGLAALLSLPAPLLPLQILFLNLPIYSPHWPWEWAREKPI